MSFVADNTTNVEVSTVNEQHVIDNCPRGKKRPHGSERDSSDDGNEGKCKKSGNTRFKIRPEGRGKTFVCDPPHLVEKAISDLTERYPKIRVITLTPGVEGGMTIYVKQLFQLNLDILCGEHDGKKWVLTPLKKGDKMGDFSVMRSDDISGTKTSFVMPQDTLEKLNLQDEEKELLPIINWFYSFYGSMVGAKDDIFIIFTANLLGEMGFISKRDLIQPGQIFKDIARIDPENIRSYNNAKETLLNATSLPDVENSYIYNPLSYTPASNVVIAVRKDHILKSLVCFKTYKSRVMSTLLARFVSELLKCKATSHGKQIGQEAFQATIVEPSVEEMRRYCGLKAIETEKILILTERELQHAKFEIQLAIHDKQTIEEQFEHHKIVNKPAQTLTHSGDNLQRVGCAVVKVTTGNDQDKQALFDNHQERDLVKLADLEYGRVTVPQANENSAILINVHVAERTSFQNKRTNLKHCFTGAKNIHSVYEEASRPLMTLLGGNRTMDVRTVLREELITFGGSGKNTLFAIPKGKLTEVMDKLTIRFQPLFAVGIFDGKVVFTNQDIMSVLPSEDAEACKTIVNEFAT